MASATSSYDRLMMSSFSAQPPQEHLRPGRQRTSIGRQGSGVALQLRAAEQAFAKRGFNVVHRGEVDRLYLRSARGDVAAAVITTTSEFCQSHDPFRSCAVLVARRPEQQTEIRNPPLLTPLS